MRVYLYERVSSEEQVNHGYSLETQDEALREWCKKNNHTIIGTYRDEGISARKSYKRRPGLLSMLQDMMTDHPDMIIFTKLDRWFRSISDYYKVQEQLEKCDICWKAIWESYETLTSSGRLHVNIMLSVAQDEADRTSERIKVVQNTLIAQGRPITGIQATGWKSEVISGIKKVVKDPEEEPMILDLIDHICTYQSSYAATKYINEKYGRTTPRLNYVRILKNTMLYGEYKGIDGFCDGYISRTKFDRIQEILHDNIKYQSRSHRVYLFTGLIRCPYCLNKLGGVFDGSSKRYRCNKHYAGLCEMDFTINESKIEQYLLDNIEKEFAKYKMSVVSSPRAKNAKSPSKYKEQLARLNEVYIMGNIPLDEYNTKTRVLKQKINDIEKNNASINDFEKTEKIRQTLSWDFEAGYAELDDEHKRAFWRGLISEIVITKDRKIDRIIFL